MALPVTKYNIASGSNTAASGAGPATAITGSAAAHTNGSASTTITLTNSPDLSGVATDGSHTIRLNTTAGTRHISKITGADNGAKTVTVEDSFNIASGSAVDYAIGGERADLDHDTSRPDSADFKAGWKSTFENGQYDQSVQLTNVAGSTTGPITYEAVNITDPPSVTLNTTADVRHFQGASNTVFRGLAFTTSSASKTTTSAINANNGGPIIFDRCRMYGMNDGILLSSSIKAVITNCEIDANTRHGIFYGNAGFCMCLVHGCYIHGNGTSGIDVDTPAGGDSNMFVDQCVIAGNTGDGINCDAAIGMLAVRGCAFASNGSDGIELSGSHNGQTRVEIRSNIFVSNGGYGIRALSTSDAVSFIDRNAYYNNTSGARLNITAGANAVTLTGDPFANAAGEDYSLNSTSGAGAACKDAGFPQVLRGSATDCNTDIGPAQGAASSPSGGAGSPGNLLGGVFQ